ncbi:hypothetical protein EV182_000344 [Spiromyces aspiralis]|uniref:Uncharacterized protein n=1 Tax=Spiromyces aspiralis TaxID=68401 RepID=A0ACC1HW37_9FUNG|nr:hypothetical protein EV182_000344 [Spiromyces aspiralis]
MAIGSYIVEIDEKDNKAIDLDVDRFCISEKPISFYEGENKDRTGYLFNIGYESKYGGYLEEEEEEKNDDQQQRDMTERNLVFSLSDVDMVRIFRKKDSSFKTDSFSITIKEDNKLFRILKKIKDVYQEITRKEGDVKVGGCAFDNENPDGVRVFIKHDSKSEIYNYDKIKENTEEIVNNSKEKEKYKVRFDDMPRNFKAKAAYIETRTLYWSKTTISISLYVKQLFVEDGELNRKNNKPYAKRKDATFSHFLSVLSNLSISGDDKNKGKKAEEKQQQEEEGKSEKTPPPSLSSFSPKIKFSEKKIKQNK